MIDWLLIDVGYVIGSLVDWLGGKVVLGHMKRKKGGSHACAGKGAIDEVEESSADRSKWLMKDSFLLDGCSAVGN